MHSIDPAPPALEARSPQATPQPVRVLTLIEATTLTGIARNVLSFAGIAGARRSGLRPFLTSLVIIARGATPDAPLLRAAREAGLGVALLDERGRFDPRALRHLRQLSAAFQPDIIESHAVKSHALVWFAGLSRRHVWIAFHHGYTHVDLKTHAYNALDRMTLRHAARVVTVAAAFRDDVRRRGVEGSRIDVLHNAAPPDGRSAEHPGERRLARLGVPAHARIVAAIGRLSKEKGHIHLIRAFAAVHSSISDSHLVIAGEGPERPRLEREIARLGLRTHVTLMGHMDDVAPLYDAADVIALPSATEGSPNVLLEAMASGVPVVATCVGGIPEIARDARTALLVRAGNVEELAAATSRLLLNPPLARQLAAEARRHVSGHFSAVRRATELAAIYDAALAARGRGAEATTGHAAARTAPAGVSEPCAF